LEWNRRDLLKTAAALVLEQWAGARHLALGQAPHDSGRKVIVVTCGGIRREDTFAEDGLANIPHLHTELLARGVFYPHVRNEGVTSHYNTISSILSGNWQRLDDWGKSRPASPTIFEYLRKQMRMRPEQVWFISSNKALTRQIGASSVREYGPDYGEQYSRGRVTVERESALGDRLVEKIADHRPQRSSQDKGRPEQQRMR